MKAGDWIEIPLSNSFAYDGTSNLVVQMASDSGDGTNYIIRSGDARYGGYHLSTPARADATGVIDAYMVDQRLWYSK
jgi:hypothetical protein